MHRGLPAGRDGAYAPPPRGPFELHRLRLVRSVLPGRRDLGRTTGASSAPRRGLTCGGRAPANPSLEDGSGTGV